MCARMIPAYDAVQLRALEQENLAEYLVYVALRDQLPEAWFVRHNLRYVAESTFKTDGNRLHPGQVDFIVVIPKHGVLFLEVKGVKDSVGRVNGVWSRLTEKGVWLSDLEKDPFEQVEKNQFNVTKTYLCKHLKRERFPGLFGNVVVMPRAKLASGVAPDVDGTLITRNEMRDLQSILLTSLKRWGRPANASLFTAATQSAVEQLLKADVTFEPVVAAATDDEGRELDRLTMEQFEVVRNYAFHNRLVVDGPAGSGKTILAMWTARSMALAGMRVLFLCYTKLLPHWLELRYGKIPGVTVQHFHGLVSDYVSRSGVGPAPSSADDDDYGFQAGAANQLIEAISALPDAARFDAIVIDEAQDFHSAWFIPVELLLASSASPIHVYLSRKQLLFAQGGGWDPDTLFPTQTNLTLGINCRNTRSIASYCGNVIQQSIPSDERLPAGIAPVIHQPVANESQRVARVKQIVEGLLRDGHRPSQIALLSPWSGEGSTGSRVGVVQGVPVAGGPADLARWANDACVWSGTVKAFKGMEADCVIVTDVPGTYSKGFTESDLYVAASRAKTRLEFVPSTAAAAELLKQFWQ
jgi:hypothetical protein